MKVKEKMTAEDVRKKQEVWCNHKAHLKIFRKLMEKLAKKSNSEQR